jgi:hypothetical protein
MDEIADRVCPGAPLQAAPEAGRPLPLGGKPRQSPMELLANDFLHSFICVLVGMMIERYLVAEKQAPALCSSCGKKLQ